MMSKQSQSLRSRLCHKPVEPNSNWSRCNTVGDSCYITLDKHCQKCTSAGVFVCFLRTQGRRMYFVSGFTKRR